MIAQGKHKNLSFFAFTATPKKQTLEMFGKEYADGSFHPFHIYSMKQAIQEGFIMDVLQNYMTYNTCFKIAKTIPDNPEVPASRAAKIIRRFEELHPYNISQKAKIIVETFISTTSKSINGMHDKLKDDKKLQKVAKISNRKIFEENIFPKTFDEVAQDSYVEQTEVYASLFQNRSKYNAMMFALAEMLYKEFNKENRI